MAFFGRFKKQDKTPEPAAPAQSGLIDFHTCNTGLASQMERMAKQYRDSLPEREFNCNDQYVDFVGVREGRPPSPWRR